MRERCKTAAQLLTDLGRNQTQLPFILCPSKKALAPLKADTKLAWRSPLIMSDNNSQFLSQAKFTSCRDAVIANPLRNISGNLFQFSRNLRMDLSQMSQEVQHDRTEAEKNRVILEATEVSKPIVNLAIKIGHRGTQTTFDPCEKCAVEATKRFESRSCQARIENTLEATAQYEDEPGSFSVSLDARTLQTMTRDQQQILVEFCRVFGVHPDRDGNMNTEATPRWDQGNEVDRMSYANPENPNVDGHFISFSPIRDQSRSPARRRITERLGEKVSSPQAIYDEDDIMNPRSSSFGTQISHDMMNPRSSSYGAPIPQYRIPSPAIVHRRDRSRERDRQSARSPTNQYRRSRSRSPPKNPFANRRGRY